MRRIKPIISLVLLLLVPIFCLCGLARHCYNSFENLYIDKIYSIFDTLSFFQFTSFTNIVGSAFALFLIPFFVKRIIDPDYAFSSSISFILKIVRRNYLLVFLFVLLVLFPASFVGGLSLKEALDFSFLKENIFTHVLDPFAFYMASILVRQEKTNIKSSLLMFIPSIAYSFVYLIMVYGVKTWDDFYYTKMVGEIIGYFSIPLIYLALFGINVLVAFLDNLLIKKLYYK